jgi:hypothetical protein
MGIDFSVIETLDTTNDFPKYVSFITVELDNCTLHKYSPIMYV